MSEIAPVKIGLLFDYVRPDSSYDDMFDTLQLVADEFVEQGIIQRPVEFVRRVVSGLPMGSFRAVRDAFHELVEEDVVVIFGPWVSENVVPLRRYVEELAEVPCITMVASESALGEYLFGLPAGSMEEEPIIMATVAHLDGARTVGIAYEDSLIGAEYLRTTRAACKDVGLRITAEVPIPQVEAEKVVAMQTLALDKPDAILHVGFGLGIPGMNAALEQIGWMPPRYTTTAFEFSANNDWWREQMTGWVGLDQYDERNPTGQAFLDRFEARYGRRPEYYMPLYCYDIGRLMLTAISTARPLTGTGVKDALEKIKMMPAACGAPGTRMRFGRLIRHGWMGTGFLVARRIPPDGSRSVMHATIDGLVEPPA